MPREFLKKVVIADSVEDIVGAMGQIFRDTNGDIEFVVGVEGALVRVLLSPATKAELVAVFSKLLAAAADKAVLELEAK